MICPPTEWYGFWETNPQRWEALKRQAEAELIAEGFEPLSGKLDAAVKKRARRYWNEQNRQGQKAARI